MFSSILLALTDCFLCICRYFNPLFALLLLIKYSVYFTRGNIKFELFWYSFSSLEASTPLASTSFWACAENSFYYFQPIRFVRFDNESVNRVARGLDSWCWPSGSRVWWRECFDSKYDSILPWLSLRNDLVNSLKQLWPQIKHDSKKVCIEMTKGEVFIEIIESSFQTLKTLNKLEEAAAILLRIAIHVLQ